MLDYYVLCHWEVNLGEMYGNFISPKSPYLKFVLEFVYLRDLERGLV